MAPLTLEAKYSQSAVVAFWTCFAQSGLQRAEALMLERYAPPPPARVLDLGCGAGRVTLALAPLGYDVTGLDITAAMLAAAQGQCAGVCGGFVQADLRRPPFAPKSFDVALIFIAALQHVAGRAQRQSALAQIARLLRTGGVLVLALDNVAPALRCYASWLMQRLTHALDSGPLRSNGESVSPDHSSFGTAAAAVASGADADTILASSQTAMGKFSWHARGLGRTLRWRTWEGVRDAGRALKVAPGERGDTFIKQVSMPPTGGRVYYHLYRHQELLDDARIAGLQLLGYHSARELAEGKHFGESARRLDKQVMYAFGKSAA